MHPRSDNYRRRKDDLNYMLRDLKEEHSIACLTINCEKSEYEVRNKDHENMTLGDKNLKRVNTCKYLGFTVNTQGNITDEIMERIDKGRKVIQFCGTKR